MTPADITCPACGWVSALATWPGVAPDIQHALAVDELEEHRVELHPTVDEIRARWTEAAPGPWPVAWETPECEMCSLPQYPYALGVPHAHPSESHPDEWPSELADMRDVDVVAISHAPTDIAVLLELVEALHPSYQRAATEIVAACRHLPARWSLSMLRSSPPCIQLALDDGPWRMIPIPAPDAHWEIVGRHHATLNDLAADEIARYRQLTGED